MKTRSMLFIPMSLLLLSACGKPDNDRELDTYTPVADGKVRFLRVKDDGSYEDSDYAVPAVSAALAKNSFQQGVDGLYNKMTMKCRIQVLSGLLPHEPIDAFRIRLATTRDELLLTLRREGTSVVSADFVCVRDRDLLGVPGLPEIWLPKDDDFVRASLVRKSKSAEPSSPASARRPATVPSH